MCTKLEKIEKIAKAMFPESTVNIAPLFRHQNKPCVILNGIQEFDPMVNRRHAWDVMIFFNLYVAKRPDEMWESGVHDINDNVICVNKSPYKAVCDRAYKIVEENEK